ncbi:transposase [Streptomyces bauhiniae]|uniref:Transposase n=1 Tax=Streptomyces bauhiniae TaxID=2340725 RepID=A0A7K3QUF2_9ACTN|nr:transposase [Streptomyces bauhiniae]
MTTDLDTLLTALYVHIDDRLKTLRWRGRPPRLTDAELVTLAVAQAVLGFHCEARWLRFAHAHLHGMFPYLPQRPAYNKRLRAALPLVKRSDLAGWANYGYCRSHSRFYWGLKLHLVCTPAGLPVTWALADPKIDERQVLAPLIDDEPHLAAARPGLLILADKGYIPPNSTASSPFTASSGCGPPTATATPRTRPLLKTFRQLIESVNDTPKGQLDLEQHGGRTVDGVSVRVAQRILAMTCAIWHNRTTGAPITRSLIAYDH